MSGPTVRPSHLTGVARGSALALAGLLAFGAAACETPRAEASRALRVCADPNNLPFSNEAGEGFENRLAELVAREMGAELQYTWWAQRRGFIRNTLRADSCDVVMGIPSSFELALPTRPYYRSTYVFVYRADAPFSIRSFDDPVLRDLRVGVQLIGDDGANTPPAHALVNRGMVENVVGYTIYGDYSQPNPPARILDALAAGEIDVAVVWGPLAGYFAPRSPVPLRLVPVSPQIDLPFLPFVYDISMGVERGDSVLKGELEAIMTRRRAEIEAILDEYGVPRVGARGSGRRRRRSPRRARRDVPHRGGNRRCHPERSEGSALPARCRPPGEDPSQARDDEFSGRRTGREAALMARRRPELAGHRGIRMVVILALLAVGCDRERRVFREVPPGATAFPAVQTTELQAGPKTIDPVAGAYKENRWAVSQGQMLFTQFNCAGCHSPGGGGGMGPPLNDASWIYGSDPENIFATIVEGRPNGMPSFRGKIGNSQVWQIAAYVRTLAGLTPKDTWPIRADAMEEVGPEPDPLPRGDP